MPGLCPKTGLSWSRGAVFWALVLTVLAKVRSPGPALVPSSSQAIRTAQRNRNKFCSSGDLSEGAAGSDRSELGSSSSQPWQLLEA